MCDQGVDGGLEHAFHDHVELVVGEADAVVGEAVLGEVVGADFFAAVAGAYLLFAVFGLELVDAFGFYFVETGAEDSHALFSIFDLRFFVLAGDDSVGGDVRDADGGVGGVDGLAARAGGAEGVDAEVFGFDLDVDFFGFGEDGDSDGGGVNAALGFGGGDALNAVDSGLVLHEGVDLVAFEDGGDVLETAADAGLGLGEDFDLPLVLLSEAEVHAEDFGYEERGFVAAGAGAELDDDVLVVVGVLGEEEDFELFFDGGEAGLEGVELGLSHLADFGVGFSEHGPGVGDALFDGAVVAELFDCGLHVGVLLGDGLILLLVLDEGGVGHLVGEVVVAGFELVEAVKHGGS